MVALAGNFNAAFSGGDAAAGKKIYEAQCTACHGVSGGGDGPMGAYLTPKPANFTTEGFLASKSDEDLDNVIKNGKGGIMPPFGSLSDEDRANIVAHLRTFAP